MKRGTNDAIILSLDTSSKNCSISITCENNIISEYNFVSNNTLSSLLIPALEFVMKTAALELEDIDIFGVGIGPGAFTGIRIGLSTLKGLIFERSVPVVPAITLKALAYKFHKVESVLIPLVQAKRDEVYMAGYTFAKGSSKVVIAPDLIHIKKLKIKLQNLNDFYFIGNGVDSFNNYLKDNFRNNKILYRSSFLATEICRIALQEYRNQNFILDPKKIKPFYLRKPDAETSIECSQD